MKNIFSVTFQMIFPIIQVIEINTIKYTLYVVYILILSTEICIAEIERMVKAPQVHSLSIQCMSLLFYFQTLYIFGRVSHKS